MRTASTDAHARTGGELALHDRTRFAPLLVRLHDWTTVRHERQYAAGNTLSVHSQELAMTTPPAANITEVQELQKLFAQVTSY